MKRKKPLLIAGPCVIESYNSCLLIAKKLNNICNNLGYEFIFKSSFDKANRSSINSFRGPGLSKGIEILKRLKKELGVKITTDIHECGQAEKVMDYVDLIQIPAFLCRQTDLLLAAARTQKEINVKKGQFMAPEDMKNVLEKIRSINDKNIYLTERGTFFGYQDLVVDIRSLIKMREFGVSVVIDATHSSQKPGSLGNISGGCKNLVQYYLKASASIGIDCFFIEVSEDPKNALSDASIVLELENVERILSEVKKIYEVATNFS